MGISDVNLVDAGDSENERVSSEGLLNTKGLENGI